MKQIPLRDFQLKANQYLKELPIVLTRYGVAVAMVLEPDAPIDITLPKGTKIKKIKNFDIDDKHLLSAGQPYASSAHLDPTPLGMVKHQTIWVDGKKHTVDENGREII